MRRSGWQQVRFMKVNQAKRFLAQLFLLTLDWIIRSREKDYKFGFKCRQMLFFLSFFKILEESKFFVVTNWANIWRTNSNFFHSFSLQKRLLAENVPSNRHFFWCSSVYGRPLGHLSHRPADSNSKKNVTETSLSWQQVDGSRHFSSPPIGKLSSVLISFSQSQHFFVRKKVGN